MSSPPEITRSGVATAPRQADAEPEEIRHFLRVVFAHGALPSTETLVWGDWRTANEPLPYALPTVDDMRGLVRAHDATEAGELAQLFASRARGISGVMELWYAPHDGEPVITAITRDFDLERDLQLQAVLIALHRDRRPARLLTLEVFAEPEGVPESARTGRRL